VTRIFGKDIKLTGWTEPAKDVFGPCLGIQLASRMASRRECNVASVRVDKLKSHDGIIDNILLELFRSKAFHLGVWVSLDHAGRQGKYAIGKAFRRCGRRIHTNRFVFAVSGGSGGFDLFLFLLAVDGIRGGHQLVALARQQMERRAFGPRGLGCLRNHERVVLFQEQQGEEGDVVYGMLSHVGWFWERLFYCVHMWMMTIIRKMFVLGSGFGDFGFCVVLVSYRVANAETAFSVFAATR
jgi:hypothetical protein